VQADQTYITTSVKGTIALGERLAARLGVGDCVALVGPLGAGKTVLVRGLARGMGVKDRRAVSSPTFVLVQEYPGRIPVFHVDLYRLTDAGRELPRLGLEEMLAAGLVIIEWAERAAGALPPGHWQVSIEPTGQKSRRFTITRPD
jgi:tRNA threonylcarbamoyladenosine biosynthesis protein TsaE